MGLMDDLEGTIEQHAGVSGQQHSTLVQKIWQKFGNSSEIEKLKASAHSQGLGGVVESWMKPGQNQPGQNQPINGGQAKGLVGEGWINEIADRTGIPQPVVAEAVAKILPGVVGKSASQGKAQAA